MTQRPMLWISATANLMFNIKKLSDFTWPCFLYLPHLTIQLCCLVWFGSLVCLSSRSHILCPSQCSSNIILCIDNTPHRWSPTMFHPASQRTFQSAIMLVYPHYQALSQRRLLPASDRSPAGSLTCLRSHNIRCYKRGNKYAALLCQPKKLITHTLVYIYIPAPNTRHTTHLTGV